jgi:hypothetical protein
MAVWLLLIEGLENDLGDVLGAGVAHGGSCAWITDITVGGPVERPLTDQFARLVTC